MQKFSPQSVAILPPERTTMEQETPSTAGDSSTTTSIVPISDVNEGLIGKWCMVIYDNDAYPGIVQDVDPESGLFVKTMSRVGSNRFLANERWHNMVQTGTCDRACFWAPTCNKKAHDASGLCLGGNLLPFRLSYNTASIWSTVQLKERWKRWHIECNWVIFSEDNLLIRVHFLKAVYLIVLNMCCYILLVFVCSLVFKLCVIIWTVHNQFLPEPGGRPRTVLFICYCWTNVLSLLKANFIVLDMRFCHYQNTLSLPTLEVITVTMHILFKIVDLSFQYHNDTTIYLK